MQNWRGEVKQLLSLPPHIIQNAHWPTRKVHFFGMRSGVIEDAAADATYSATGHQNRAYNGGGNAY